MFPSFYFFGCNTFPLVSLGLFLTSSPLLQICRCCRFSSAVFPKAVFNQLLTWMLMEASGLKPENLDVSSSLLPVASHERVPLRPLAAV